MDSSATSTRTTTRRPCFIEEDDQHIGLASLAETQPGFSGTNNNNTYNHYPLISRPLCYRKRNTSLRNLSSLSSVVGGGRYCYDGRFEEPQPHFLESCFLCKKSLDNTRDIFMYRGDTPFCSEECRQQQIEMDETKEQKWSISAMKALRKKEQNKSSTSSSSSSPQDYSFKTGTVAAA